MLSSDPRRPVCKQETFDQNEQCVSLLKGVANKFHEDMLCRLSLYLFAGMWVAMNIDIMVGADKHNVFAKWRTA